jgi:hypothetical protein
VVLTACSPATTGGEATVRDSAGVQIVTNVGEGAWTAGDGWRLSDRPAVTIGTVQGPPAQQLDRVPDAARLSDGTIVVGNGGTGELRFFDARGQHVATAGGSGGGPGEFRQLTALESTDADSVFVYDAQASRISVFSGQGTFVRSVSLEDDPAGLSPAGWFVDGSFVAEGSSVASDEQPTGEGLFTFRTASTFHLYGRGGEHIRELATLAGDVRTALLTSGGSGDFRIRTASIPFLRELHADVGDRLLVTAGTDRRSVRYYDSVGSLVRIVRDEADRPRPLEEEHLESWVEEQVDGAEDRAARRRLRNQLEQIELDPLLPRFEALLLGAGDRLWMREYRPPGAEPGPATWTVFGTEGRRLGTVEMPSRFEPFEIGDGYALGVWTAELDVQTIRLYRLLRRGDG